MILSPFEVRFELDGWSLTWARLVVEGERPTALAALRTQVADAVRARFTSTSELAAHSTIAALRALFRAAGCDPTRYRPSSEALLRRLVKGEALPAIHPLVDVSNCLSAELAVPCCVMAEGTFAAPMVFRSGRSDESYLSLRGPFRLEGKPVLVDQDGPLDTPITGNLRVKVRDEARSAWLVVYLPAAAIAPGAAASALAELARGTGVGIDEPSG